MGYLWTTIEGFLLWLTLMPLSWQILCIGFWAGIIRLVWGLCVHRE